MRFTNQILDLCLSIICAKTVSGLEFVFEALMNFLTMDCFHMAEICRDFKKSTKISLFQK